MSPNHNLRILLILLTFPYSGFSQTENNPAAIEYSLHPKSEMKNNNGNTFSSSSNSWHSVLKFALYVKDSLKLINSFEYQNVHTNGNDLISVYPFVEQIEKIGYSIFVLKDFNKFSLMLTSGLNFSSNYLKDFSFNQLIFRGGAVFMHKFRNNKIELIGAGVSISSDFGKPTILPMLVTKVRFSSKISLKAFLPMRSNLSYKLSEKTMFGIQQKVNLNAYIFSDKFRSDTSQFGKLRSLNLGVFVEQNIYKAINLSASGGLWLQNSLFVYNVNDNQTDLLKGAKSYWINMKFIVKLSKDK